MTEFSASDYGIFSDGVKSVNTLNDKLGSIQSELNNAKNNLNSDSVFMGPICDNCVEKFGKLDTKVSSTVNNYKKIGEYLNETAVEYTKGDTKSAKKILKFENGEITSSNFVVDTGNATKDAIFNYLANQGFNNAAICGIMANMESESSFRLDALGDGGTSYGLCQWHNERWTALRNYCNQNGLSESSLEGQLGYLMYELKNNYSNFYNEMLSVPNTQQGAYDAAYRWTVSFERPANADGNGRSRGSKAQNENYWGTYGLDNIKLT